MLLGFGENEHLPGHLLCAFKCRRPEPQPSHFRCTCWLAVRPATPYRGPRTHPAAHVALDGRGVPTHQRSLRRREGAAGRALQPRAGPACRPRPLPAQNETRLRLLAGSPLLPPPPPDAYPATSEQTPSRPRKPPLAAAQPRSARGACAERSAARARLRSREGAEAEPRPVAGGWGRKSEVSADVRVESGRSARLRAEVRLGSLSAIVDPRRGERERGGECASGRDGPLPPTPEREALFLAS